MRIPCGLVYDWVPSKEVAQAFCLALAMADIIESYCPIINKTGPISRMVSVGLTNKGILLSLWLVGNCAAPRVPVDF